VSFLPLTLTTVQPFVTKFRTDQRRIDIVPCALPPNRLACCRKVECKAESGALEMYNKEIGVADSWRHLEASRFLGRDAILETSFVLVSTIPFIWVLSCGAGQLPSQLPAPTSAPWRDDMSS